MKKFFRSIWDKIWSYFFLDFYFDKRWTFRFKLMHFISGGVLLWYFTDIRHNLINADYYIKLEPEKHAPDFYTRRAKKWADEAWKEWRK